LPPLEEITMPSFPQRRESREAGVNSLCLFETVLCPIDLFLSLQPDRVV
jgi:hypothetical protein